LYDDKLARELSRVTYLIEPRGALCKLTVLHDLADAPETAKHVGKDGWHLIVSSLKTLWRPANRCRRRRIRGGR
ncbi:MAG TPA: hypothetical protein VH083_17180, partial [Myxococcales bacterium]|nr:hypothetical protein [Myxococcales bacterium]